MISRIGRLVMQLSISAVACCAALMVLPPRQVHAAQVDIPAGVFTALVAPAKNVGIAGGGMKHVSLAINPDNGRIYTQGGDYSFQNYQQSYQQSFFSFSLAERLASPANPNAGWTLEQGYCRTDGGVQPKHPDFVGWTWDSKRHVFWMVPGVMEGSNDICPGETTNRTGDPNFIHNQLMTFDPVTRRWTVVNSDIGPDAADTWQSIYDPVTDSLIRMGKNGSTCGVVNIYDITSRSWSKYNLGPNALGQDVSVSKEGLAADIVGRVIYTVDGYSGRLHRFNIDAKKMADLGPVPGGSR